MTEFLIACLRNLNNKLVTKGHHRASQRTLEYMDSELYDAIIRDENHVFKEIEGRLSVCNQRTPTNCTVLHVACQYRRPAFHAMFDGPDGRTALHAAVLDDGGCDVLNISECVKLLLDKNKDLLKVHTLADQAMIKKTLINANVQKHWHLWRTLKEPDIEMQNRVAIQDEKNAQEVKEYKKLEFNFHTEHCRDSISFQMCTPPVMKNFQRHKY
ncbi:hypothetical protein POM88_000506 [Heracleum sosnowskyi]|uniref:Uncharacterized protein n=1 Tax=Heracleum sosnowskyi TaxID=360622 RepID=A0AAD8JE32_9APIA|nr:hypothetical protein POM88_000506 [Heracleum sosnowskyi]